MDLDGRTINELGYFVNKDGDRIDKDGNLLDDDGNYVIKVDYEKPTARKRGRKPSRTTKTKVTTDS